MILSNFAMHATNATIFGFPRLVNRSNVSFSNGFQRIPVNAGRYNSFRTRCEPHRVIPVRLFTLEPDTNTRGLKPTNATNARADEKRVTSPNSANSKQLLFKANPGMLCSSSKARASCCIVLPR